MTSIVGPLGIDPLYFALALFGSLLLFVLYLLLPRGFRVHYFASYPKRYAWSAKPRRMRKVSLAFFICISIFFPVVRFLASPSVICAHVVLRVVQPIENSHNERIQCNTFPSKGHQRINSRRFYRERGTKQRFFRLRYFW